MVLIQKQEKNFLDKIDLDLHQEIISKAHISCNSKSSCSQALCKIAVLKSFDKITGKCRARVSLIKFQAAGLQDLCVSDWLSDIERQA